MFRFVVTSVMRVRDLTAVAASDLARLIISSTSFALLELDDFDDKEEAEATELDFWLAI